MDLLTKVIESSCTRRLREKEAGIYTLLVWASVQKMPYIDSLSRYECRIEFDCGSTITERLIRAAAEEIERLRKEGPEMNDFKAALEKCKKSWLSSNRDDINSDKDMLALEGQMNALRPEDIQEAVRKYLQQDRFISYVEVGGDGKKEF
jgi:uncharacterized protein YhaN